MPALSGRPPAFTYHSNKSTQLLHCDQVKVPALAERFGTPLYLYSGSNVRERYRAFAAAFADVPHTVCYSVKANSNLALLKLLAGEGSGFDVVSGGELQRVLKVSRRAPVVFSGVGKTADEMDLALGAGILMFNLESEGELELLASRAAKARKRANIAVRVNPDVSAETHPYIATGLHQHKFGVPMERARKLYGRAARQRWLRPAGVSVHIGSQITDVKPFAAAMTRVAELVRTLRADGLEIEHVDAGGGLGIFYQQERLPELAKYAAAYAKAVMAPLRELNVHVMLEPGRFIVGPAGALITRVLYVKENDGKRFVVVDAAMNDLIRPSLYGAHHEIVPVVMKRSDKTGQMRGSKTEKFDVVGPVCETGDFFARDRELPEVAPGDLLAILDAGAYGMALASNYNSRPLAAEVLVEGRGARVIREREGFRDMIRKEKP